MNDLKRLSHRSSIPMCILFLGVNAFVLEIARGKEFAKVGPVSITEKNLDRMVIGMNPEQKKVLLLDSKNREDLLSKTIDQEVLYQTALEKGLDKTEKFNTAIEMYKRQWLVSELLGTQLGARVNEDSIKKFYEANKWKYSTEQVRVYHVVLHDPALVPQVIEGIGKTGKNFGLVSAKFSKDPTYSQNKGELGWIGWGSPLPPELKEAAMRARLGQPFGPVRTQAGYHVLLVTDKKQGKTIPFSEVSNYVLEDYKTALSKQYTGEIRLKQDIKILDPKLTGY